MSSFVEKEQRIKQILKQSQCDAMYANGETCTEGFQNRCDINLNVLCFIILGMCLLYFFKKSYI